MIYSQTFFERGILKALLEMGNDVAKIYVIYIEGMPTVFWLRWVALLIRITRVRFYAREMRCDIKHWCTGGGGI